jgi:hypothetical protein
MGEYLKDAPILYVDRAIGKVAFSLMFWDVDVELTL